MPNDDALPDGIYESVVTRRLLERLRAAGDRDARLGAIDQADLAHVLGRHVGESVLRVLRSTKSVDVQADLVARLLAMLDAADESPDLPPRQLLSIKSPTVFGVPARSVEHPATPLSDAALLTNAPNDPQLGSELRSELRTANRVDLLMAFVKWHGLRVLESALDEIRAREVPFRVITTTYLAGTERVALDRLVKDYGAEVRVQYDARRTRLHAKAWLFHRDTGFDTAYVGSSNLSRVALLDGAEWNVRLSRIGTPTLLEKFAATFESYWNSDQYERYDPELDRDRIDDALRAALDGGRARSGGEIRLSGLQVRPYPYQTAILDALEAERAVHDRHRNLVVAATGTGKTVIAALDYQRLAARMPRADGTRPRLLFVAHRGEILQQSLRTYREVLSDANFGELYVGGARPERWQHVFASVQSLTAYDVRNIPRDAFEVVVIDEFHHAQARTYRSILDHLDPTELLGLTATPERGDGTDVRAMFGGRTAAELRLWDAIDADLLTPFHYFGLGDTTDLTHVAWRAGRYDESGLDSVFTGNDARARIVLQQVADKISDPTRMRALGFCVSVAHAAYMARVFVEAGLSARAVSGQTPAAERAAAVAALRAGEVSALFAADLFNEGLDIPEVDTVLFLRPTDSVTLFLQQLGRGLRLADEKAVLTVLDFVGRHRAEFRLDQRFQALTRTSRKRLEHEIERGFPHLPSGCQIVLDEFTRAEALRSVRQHLAVRRDHLIAELRAQPTDALSEFLHNAGVELADVLKRGERSFTLLRRDAGLVSALPSPLEAVLAKRVRAVAHVDDARRAAAYTRLLSANAPDYQDLSGAERRLADMLYFSMFPGGGQHTSIGHGLRRIRHETELAGELAQVIELALDGTRHTATPLTGRLVDIPLLVHATYQREEALAALGYASLNRLPNSFREGVLRIDTGDGEIDAFFVTLRKSEADYSPTTMYADYPISPTLFHWESQSTTSVASPTGQRYLHGTGEKLLFVRTEKEGEFGTMPYVFLGPVDYVSHRGDRPIAITWRLRTPMPADLFTEAAVAL